MLLDMQNKISVILAPMHNNLLKQRSSSDNEKTAPQVWTLPFFSSIITTVFHQTTPLFHTVPLHGHFLLVAVLLLSATQKLLIAVHKHASSSHKDAQEFTMEMVKSNHLIFISSKTSMMDILRLCVLSATMQTTKTPLHMTTGSSHRPETVLPPLKSITHLWQTRSSLTLVLLKHVNSTMTLLKLNSAKLELETCKNSH